MSHPTKSVVFSNYAQERLRDRGDSEAEVLEAIRQGEPEPARRGLTLYREVMREWGGC